SGIRPTKAFMSVVLPLPLGPMIANSPFSILPKASVISSTWLVLYPKCDLAIFMLIFFHSKVFLRILSAKFSMDVEF
ncbi:hypothetical protein M153_26802000541, partial [Pseudoloma neurophilia]